MATKKRKAKKIYHPEVRRRAGAPLDTSALNASKIKKLAHILDLSIRDHDDMAATLDEISDSVSRYRRAVSGTEKFPSTSAQKKNTDTFRKAIREAKAAVAADCETRKRLSLFLGRREQDGNARFNEGQRLLESWLTELESASEHARWRLPSPKTGPKRRRHLSWLIEDLARIWEEVTDTKFIVSRNRIQDQTITPNPKAWPRWFVETALDCAGIADLGDDALDYALKAARKRRRLRRPRSELSDESDQIFD